MKRVSKAAGFTLMEVLIAMTLLSIMVVLLFASLKICAQSWERGESKMADVNEVGVVYNFFQQHLSSAKPLWDDFSVPGQRTLAFQGDAKSLQFVGDFPDSVAKPGAQLITLQLQEFEEGNAITVTLAPFLPEHGDKPLPKEEVTLIKGVRNVSFAYFGADENGSEPSWQTEWLQREAPPQLVKIGIELDNAMFWPDMVIELKVANALFDLDGTGQGTETEQNNEVEE